MVHDKQQPRERRMTDATNAIDGWIARRVTVGDRIRVFVGRGRLVEDG